jgi:hypothetical protein
MPLMSSPVCEHFLAWQCRLRQVAMRKDGGRPSPGMRPSVTRNDGTQIAPAISLLIIEKDPAVTVDLLRHTARKTHDPRKRYEDGLKILSAEYYEDPREFSDVMTGLFAAHSETAATLRMEGRCILHFEQESQTFNIPCAIHELSEKEPSYQLTYWHNHLFNPYPPSQIRMLAFQPDWIRSSAG